MDAFYASVEQLDDPDLAGLPVAVGGSGPRGVVAAASYEAREYGVRSAMPTQRALDLCPMLRIVTPRFERYKEISSSIKSIFRDITPLVEPLSLDEAYLDITGETSSWKQAIDAAKEIKHAIYRETGLTATAGIGQNKFIAKMASQQDKPDGLTLITPEETPAFIDALPVRAFFGVGEATATRMELHGVHYGRHLRKMSELELVERYGKLGSYLFSVVRGVDDRPVKPDRPRKSISVERTYGTNLEDPAQVAEAISHLSTLLEERISRANVSGRTISLKIRFSNFTTVTRQHTADLPIQTYANIQSHSLALLDQLDSPLQPIRLLGIGISGIDPDSDPQLSLRFPDESE